jgi:protease I
MAGKLEGRKIAILAADGVEQVELTEPRKAVEDAGAQTELIGLEEGEILGFNHLDHGDTFPVDRAVADAKPDDYDGLLIPGGVANGDFLRADEDAVRFVAAFAEAHKPATGVAHVGLDDIPAFSAKAIEEFCEGAHEDMPQPSGSAAA